MTPTLHSARLVSLCLALALAACSSQPPAPDWQMNAHGAAQKAVQAYLSGETRVATLEFARARQETARTGQPALLAQVHLLECAAQVASLELTPCSAFDTLRPDASAAQTAYADYLAGTLAPQAAALLPQSQQAVALATDANAATALAAIADPWSRLVAAGVLLRTGRASPQTMELATETASTQGWRRPLLAWLWVAQERARVAGAADEVARLQRRIDIVGQDAGR